MTSLIDVIFLLLLFFMLTSTFSKFSEVELTAAGSGTRTQDDRPPLFLELEPAQVHLNTDPVDIENLAASALGTAKDGTLLLISMTEQVNAQRLTDLLVALRALPHLRIAILET